jgi:ion channel-forming bestrophin family protein
MAEIPSHRRSFWREAFALSGSITPHVLPLVISFGLIAAAVVGLAWYLESVDQERITLEVAPHEIAGAALGLLLILRTNAGYDRWWEARKLWGGIVNQCRNLAISGLAYGPAESSWRQMFVRWTAVFPHIARCSLRGEPPSSEVAALIGEADAARLAKSDHMPSFVAGKLADLLREACDQYQMDRFAFLQVDRERALLMDHIGGCERILKTPLPLVYSIKIRRAITLFLLTLPFALLHKMEADWLLPFITMLVAYPFLALDQIGIELQNPFAKANVSHLPLGEISATIEKNVLSLLSASQGTAASVPSDVDGPLIQPIPSGPSRRIQ